MKNLLRSVVPCLQSAGIILCLSVSAMASGSVGRVWHVSQAVLPGVDEPDQMRTISEAAQRVGPGDTVVIHSGTYREAVTVEQSGTADQPIRFVAAPGDRVVVTGADLITQWEPVGSDPNKRIFKARWTHRFITWNDPNTHPNDDYHRVIGRAEQVFVNHYLLSQVLSRDEMSRGSFYVDTEAQELYIWDSSNGKITDEQTVEASAREVIWKSKGSYLEVHGIRFRYAANHAQQGAVAFDGDHNLVEDCVFEKTNGAGADFGGKGITVRRCTFQDNGQLGFGASGAHDLHMSDCTIRSNNTKNFDRGWEAGGNKLSMSRGVVLENSRFVENRGHGIWFDIGNEDCTVRNCLIADNEDAGIFYEISYGLHAYDNVIVGNGFDSTPESWGANGGISISSSPGCLIERNLLIGNKEGFQFREQGRTTPRIGHRRGEAEVPIWNHDEVIRNNVLAFNRDAQVWGWFDTDDDRHLPAAKQRKRPGEEQWAGPADLSLEKLNLKFENNLYYAAPGQGLINWGCSWSKHANYTSLAEMRSDLGLDEGGRVADPGFRDFTARDLRVPGGSPAVTMGCYPKGQTPGVTLGETSEEGDIAPEGK